MKFASNHSRAGICESWDKKLVVAPRSSDLSSWWQNIAEDNGGMAKAKNRNGSSIDLTLMSYELRDYDRVVVTYGPTTHTAFSQIHSGESV